MDHHCRILTWMQDGENTAVVDDDDDDKSMIKKEAF